MIDRKENTLRRNSKSGRREYEEREERIDPLINVREFRERSKEVRVVRALSSIGRDRREFESSLRVNNAVHADSPRMSTKALFEAEKEVRLVRPWNEGSEVSRFRFREREVRELKEKTAEGIWLK